MPAPNILIELIHLILIQLYDDRPTLLTCALVSKDWLASSRSIYCSYPDIGIIVPLYPPQTKSNVTILCRIGSEFDEPSRVFQYGAAQPNSTWIRFIQNLDLELTHNPEGIEITRKVLPLVAPNIRKLRLGSYEPGAPFMDGVTFPRVHSLEIGVCYGFPEDLCRALVQFPELVTLKLGGFSSAIGEVPKNIPPPTTLRIQRLGYILSRGDDSLPFLQYLTEHIRTIESLHISHWNANRTGHVGLRNVFENLGPSLKDLTLDIRSAMSRNREGESKVIDMSFSKNTNLRSVHFFDIPLTRKTWDPLINLIGTFPNPSRISLALSFDTANQYIAPDFGNIYLDGLADGLHKNQRLPKLEELKIEIILSRYSSRPLPPMEAMFTAVRTAFRGYNQEGRLEVKIGPPVRVEWAF